MLTRLIFVCLIGSLHLMSQTIPNTNSEALKSSLNIPISIPLSSIDAILNKSIAGIIYQDTLYGDHNPDDFKCKVWKAGNIKLTGLSNYQYNIAVPLKVWVDKGYGAFGLMNYQQLTFQMVMNFKITIALNPNWTVSTKTEPNGYAWVQRPVLDFKVIQIPVSPIVEKILDMNYKDIASKIDDKIKSYINLKKEVMDAWNQMASPILLSDSFNTWLKITPLLIKAVPIVQSNNVIYTTIGFDILTKTIVGEVPQKDPLVNNIPNLTYISALDRDFQLQNIAHISYAQATKIARDQFNGDTMAFSDGKYKLIIDDVQISPHQKRFLIQADVRGSLNGSVFIEGDPYYDSISKSVKMQNIEFDLKTKNIFKKSLAWLFEGVIEKKIQQNFEIPTKELMETTLQSTNQALNKKNGMISTVGRLYSIEPTQLTLSEQYISIYLLLKGQLSIQTN